MRNIILKITRAVLAAFILIVCMNTWLSTLYKGAQRPVGTEVVSVYTPRYYPDELLVPVQDDNFNDTGRKVSVCLHNNYPAESHLKNVIRNIAVLFIAYLLLGKLQKLGRTNQGYRRDERPEPT